MNSNILHIINDYAGSAVYKNLVREIDLLGLTQTVYTPVRNHNQIGKNSIEFTLADSKLYYRNILILKDRALFKKKIQKVVRDVENTVDLDKISMIHAHTWFSDGAVAYELSKKLKIPYIIAIRGTDVNVFAKYMFHLRPYGIEILTNAKKIILISPVLNTKLLALSLFETRKDELMHKVKIIPNGVDLFWISNIRLPKSIIGKKAHLLYVGRFLKKKNVLSLCKVVERLNTEGTSCKLHLVGGGGRDESKILKFIRNKDSFQYYGIVTSKKALREIFERCDIFTMPSRHETFGLVYIEALTQGLPIIYSINDGIYGYFDASFGEAVNPKNLDSISSGIKKIICNYDTYDFNIKTKIANHNWEEIAKNYFSVYKELV